MSNGHAIYSPSGAKKWMTCPGSIAMEQGEPDGDTSYADEGTAAHALASMCLTEGTHPAAYIGRVLAVVNGVYYPHGLDDPAGVPDKDAILRQFPVDFDMAGAVNAYVQRVRECVQGGTLLVEQKVPISHVTGEEGATGTADAVILSATELQVHDYKHGVGVPVDAKDNPQGLIYLLGALEAYGAIGDFETFRFVVHQPRSQHGATISEHVVTRDELLAFGVKVRERAQNARTATEFASNWIGKDNSYLAPGDHCKSAFCKARGKCPELANFVQEAIGADFDTLSSIYSPQAQADIVSKLVPVDLRTLGQYHAAVEMILDWCKAVRARVEAVLFEHENDAATIEALGHKLVAGKRGNRQWSSEDEAEALLKKMRMKNEEVYDFKLKSPTSIEKVLKEEPKRWARVQPLIVQKYGQPSVAPVGDKRPALIVKPVADDFEAQPVGSDLL